MRQQPEIGESVQGDAGANPRGPFKTVSRVILTVLLVVAVATAASFALFFLAGTKGILRPIVAMLMSIGIAWFGIGYFKQMGNPPPPDLEPMAVDPALRLAYICEMCGLELAVVMAAKEKAPKHCGEAMILIRL
ncbi:MAG: hypothetical protein ACR2FO_00945 [Actinomycetota bacterium]